MRFIPTAIAEGVEVMSKSARSVSVFGVYLAVLGLVLLAAPNFLLQIFAMLATDEVWIRVVGVLVILLSYYYYVASRTDSASWPSTCARPAQ